MTKRLGFPRSGGLAPRITMQAQILCSHCSVDVIMCRGLRPLKARQPHSVQSGRTLCGSSRAFQQRLTAHKHDLLPLSWPCPPPHALGGPTAAAADVGTQRRASPIQASERRRVVCQTASMVPAISSASSDESDQTAEAQSSPLQGTRASTYLH